MPEPAFLMVDHWPKTGHINGTEPFNAIKIVFPDGAKDTARACVALLKERGHMVYAPDGKSLSRGLDSDTLHAYYSTYRTPCPKDDDQ